MRGSKRLPRLILRWLPPLIWMALIFYLSSQPDIPSVPGSWDLVVKKTMHALAYGVLTWLYLRALRASWSHNAKTRAASATLALLYAVSDECHQTFVPGRGGTAVDVVIDGLGVAAVTLLDYVAGSRHHPAGEEASQ